MNLRRTHINQRGVSLVELMIAMLLGLFLMIGVIQVFVSSKSTYNTQESLSRVQESGRHAVAIMTRDLRMAGYTGCGGASENVHNHLANEADSILNFSEGVFGSEAAGTGPGDELDLADDDPDGAWSPDLPAGTGSVDIQPLPGSDVLMVRTVSSGVLTAEPPGGSDVIQPPPAVVHMTSGNHDFQQGEILLITDCANAGIVQMTQAAEVIINFAPGGGNKGNNDWPDENAITGDASAARLEAAVYFVGLNDEDVPTLYRQNLSTAAAAGGGAAADPQAIAEGVENMQVLYGTRGAGTALQVDQFRTAAQIDAASRWADVIAVQVALLVRDEDRLPGGIADRARTFDLGSGEPAGYRLTVEPDGLQRQVFRATITLRNKAL